MTEPHIPGRGLALSTTAARNRETVRAFHTMALAMAADAAALDNPPWRLLIEDAQGTDGAETMTWQARWPVSDTAGYLWLRWWRSQPRDRLLYGGLTIAVTLTVTDAVGTSVTVPSTQLPQGFSGETMRPGWVRSDHNLDAWWNASSSGCEGFLDVATLRSVGGLAGSDWTLTVSCTTSDSAVFLSRLEAWEVPGFATDQEVDHRGMPPGLFLADAPITDSNESGYQRLLATIGDARTLRPCYLDLAWPLTADAFRTPSLTAAGEGPFTLLDEPGVVTGVPFEVFPRQVLRPSAQGEPCRWRVLYKMTGGTKDGRIHVRTTSTSSPFSTAWLANTATWTWSPWIAGYLRTNNAGPTPPAARDTIKVTGEVSAADGTILWLGGVYFGGDQA